MPKGKRLMAMLLCLVLLGTSIGATIAYLNDKSNTVTNTFIPGKAEITIEENNEAAVKKDVVIRNPQNTENVPVYIRAKIVATWQDANGNIYGEAPVRDTDYYINGPGTGWVLHTDGYYYYKEPVNPGGATSKLIESAALIQNVEPPEDYFLCIDVLASAVQSDGVNASNQKAVEALWGVDPSTLGTS